MAISVHDAPADPAGPDAGSEDKPAIDLVWRCADCGHQRLAVEAPGGCTACGAPATHVVGRTSIEWRFLLRHAAKS